MNRLLLLRSLLCLVALLVLGASCAGDGSDELSTDRVAAEACATSFDCVLGQRCEAGTCR